MLAQFGERRQHLGRMMHLVELPQRRNAMEEVMAEPIGEFIGEQFEQRRQSTAPLQTGQAVARMRRRGRRLRPATRRVAAEEAADREAAVAGGEHEAVEDPQPHVDASDDFHTMRAAKIERTKPRALIGRPRARRRET